MGKISYELKLKHKEERKIFLEDYCKRHLDNDKYANMSILLRIFNELKMKPRWFYSGKYRCDYKNKAVVYISISNGNFNITVATNEAKWNTIIDGGVNDFIKTLNDEMKIEFISHFKQCNGCFCNTNKKTYFGVGDVEIDGVVHKNVCYKNLVYTIDNPDAEQIKWIEKFIIARRKYIERT